MILDTSFLVDLMRNKHNAVAQMQKLVASSESIAITAPTVFELCAGIELSGLPDCERDKVSAVLSDQIVFSLDSLSARNAGELHGKLMKRGESIGAVDCMVAGIALKHGEAILTRDVKHFLRVAGLKVETY